MANLINVINRNIENMELPNCRDTTNYNKNLPLAGEKLNILLLFAYSFVLRKQTNLHPFSQLWQLFPGKYYLTFLTYKQLVFNKFL